MTQHTTTETTEDTLDTMNTMQTHLITTKLTQLKLVTIDKLEHVVN
jgi:hypothetical protein